MRILAITAELWSLSEVRSKPGRLSRTFSRRTAESTGQLYGLIIATAHGLECTINRSTVVSGPTRFSWTIHIVMLGQEGADCGVGHVCPCARRRDKNFMEGVT